MSTTPLDQETWRMQYLLLDTSNMIGGVHVMVPTELTRHVDWLDQRLSVNTARDRIRSAPRYDAAQPLDRTLEEALARHYDLRARAPRPRAAGKGCCSVLWCLP